MSGWVCPRNTEVTRDTYRKCHKTATRRVARLETVKASPPFIKVTRTIGRTLYLERTRTDVCFAPTTGCADLRWTAPYLASYVFSCVFNKRSDPSCEGRIAGSLLSALHACTETVKRKNCTSEHNQKRGRWQTRARAAERARPTQVPPLPARSSTLRR